VPYLVQPSDNLCKWRNLQQEYIPCCGYSNWCHIWFSLQITSTSGETFSKNISLVVVTPTGAISGDVDAEGITETPNGAILTYTGPKNGSITLGITGGYTIENLPGGSYRIVVSKSGFVPVPAYRDVVVSLGQTTSGIDFNRKRSGG